MSEAHCKKNHEAWRRMIHFEIDEDGNKHYLCNQACATHPEKRTLDKEKVTCRNCLNKLKKGKEE